MLANSPFARLAFAFGIALANMALVFTAAPIKFFPSELAVNLGIMYGALCAAYHAYAARLAANHAEALTKRQKKLLTGALTSKAVVGVALIQLVFGIAAFSDGAGALYTWSFGHTGETTHVVA